MDYLLKTSIVLSSLPDQYILRALIVMILWQCSYRDVEAYYYTDIIVRWFLREHKSKSETHRRAKKLKDEIKKTFNQYTRELEKELEKLQDYLPSSALYGKVGQLWAVDSNIIEVPFGKGNKQTLKKKFELAMRQKKIKEAARLIYYIIKTKRLRRHNGEFTKKRNKTFFGFKVLYATSPTMLVHFIQVELANFPDNKVGFTMKGYKIVDRGFVGMSSTWLIGFPSFRRYVEFFGIFLKSHWRPYATDKEMIGLFVYVIALVYNSMIYTSVLSRVPEKELVI